MTLGFDDVTLTSTGTATAESQLNDGASLTSPDSARLLLEVIPYQMELGAFTADESLFTAFRLGSDDVNLLPKRFVLPNINTGDAAFASVQAPALKAYTMNTPLNGNDRINYYAQPLSSNTVAAGVGATAVYSTGGGGTEQFYQRADDDSAGGTTINTRTTGGTITITGGSEITGLYTVVSGATATASQHDVGFMEFESSDFNTPMPYRVAIQPTATGLGGAAGANTGGGGIMEYNMPQGAGIPIAERCVVNTFYTNRDARTGGSNFIGFCRYTK